jgi:hypothetical protein
MSDVDQIHKIQTLYVARPLERQSATQLREWAKSVGFDHTLEPSDMHVTVACSKRSVDWSMLRPATDTVTVLSDARSISPLGDKGAVVLKLDSKELTRRWYQFLNIGCSWDYEGYQPHVTISYNGPAQLPQVAPYDLPIVLGPEKWAPVVLDWDKKIKES